MLKIHRKELNDIMNFVNFPTGIDNITKNKNLFRQNYVLNVLLLLTLRVFLVKM